jgi:hypothetical protein
MARQITGGGIPELRPELIPPRESKAVGIHTDGRTIYEMEKFDIEATVASKKQVMDPDGEPQWRKHPTTGEKLYPVMSSQPVFSTVRFVLDRSPRGHVRMDENFEGTPESIARDTKAKKVREFSDKLAELATERGVDPEAVIEKVIEEAGGEPEEAIPYPQHKGGGHWLLSNGTSHRGSKEDAHIAEAVLHVEVPAEEAAY